MDCSKTSSKIKLNERLMSVIIDIIIVLDLLGVEINFETTISNLISYSNNFNFLKNTYDFSNIYKLAS